MRKRILCFGDSNTWGAIPGEDGRFPDDVRWTGVMSVALGDGYTVIEEGYNGRTTVFDDPVEGRLSGITYFKPCVESHSPLDLVIVMLGTNDLKTRFASDAVSIAYGLKNYTDVMKTASLHGSVPVFLAVSPILVDPAYKNDPLFGDCFGPDADRRSIGFAKAYGEFAAENGVEFFDAALAAKASGIDGIHLDAAGHKALGTALAAKVRELLGNSCKK